MSVSANAPACKKTTKGNPSILESELRTAVEAATNADSNSDAQRWLDLYLQAKGLFRYFVIFKYGLLDKAHLKNAVAEEAWIAVCGTGEESVQLPVVRKLRLRDIFPNADILWQASQTPKGRASSRQTLSWRW